MLPLALRMLCHAFNVKSSKGYFPFLLNNIFYNDILPKFELYYIFIVNFELICINIKSVFSNYIIYIQFKDFI